MPNSIKQFFSSEAYAVIGVSSNQNKFGNKVFRCLKQHFSVVYPIHQIQSTIEGIQCIKSISDLPKQVQSLSVVTPPTITEQVVEDAHNRGIKNIWIQPGAESITAIEACRNYKINLIAQGPCILVELEWFTHPK